MMKAINSIWKNILFDLLCWAILIALFLFSDNKPEFGMGFLIAIFVMALLCIHFFILIALLFYNIFLKRYGMSIGLLFMSIYLLTALILAVPYFFVLLTIVL
jgi:uncharacterized RDD family membrane protein YckC